MSQPYLFKDAELGTIVVKFRTGMASYTARWKENILCVNVPLGTSSAKLMNFINTNRQLLLQRRPLLFSYRIGQVIHCFRHDVTIGSHSARTNSIGYGGTGSNLYINVPPNCNIDDMKIMRTISACLSRLMVARAQATLIPFAQQVATEIKVAPKQFVIGRGLRKLGHCTMQQEIQLSYNLMFFPEELVRYIIYHECAHLTEMNHSPRFHTLCNLYCQGREKSLERALKHFVWPIIK